MPGNYQKLLILFSSAFVLMPLSFGIFRFNHLSSGLKILTVFLGFVLLTEVVSIFLGQNHKNNLWLLNSYSLAEGFVILAIIRMWLPSKNDRTIVGFCILIYVLAWLYSNFWDRSIFQYNEKEITIKELMILGASSTLLLKMSLNSADQIYRDYRFWILFGFMFDSSINLIIYYTANFVFENHTHVTKISWPIHSASTVISNLLLTLGFIWFYRKKTSYI